MNSSTLNAEKLILSETKTTTPNLYPFQDETKLNSTIANEDFMQFIPTNDNQEFVEWNLPSNPHVWYDLKHSWFQFDLHLQAQQGSSAVIDIGGDGQIDTNLFSNPGNLPFLSMFHSVLRYLDLQIWANGQLVNDTTPDNLYPYKEFAKHCINTSGSSINELITLNGVPINTVTVSTADSKQVANTGITSFEGGNTTLGFGTWEHYISYYVYIRSSRLTVKFQPNDGFWKMNNFFPGTVPIKIRIIKRNDPNANYWWMVNNNWSGTVNAYETTLNQVLWLRQIFLTNAGMNIYQTLLAKNSFRTYNVQHCESVVFQIPPGFTQFTKFGLFSSRKPQIVTVHVVPTANFSTTKPARIHPFANLTNTINPVVNRTNPYSTNPVNPLTKNYFQSAVVQYGYRKYPRSWDYVRDNQGNLGTCVQDYQQYLHQCKITYDGNLTNKLPLLNDDVYTNKQLTFLCYTLQDNGTSFHDTQYLENTTGSLNITLSFIDQTVCPLSVIVTAFTNEILTVGNKNIVSKSY